MLSVHDELKRGEVLSASRIVPLSLNLFHRGLQCWQSPVASNGEPDGLRISADVDLKVFTIQPPLAPPVTGRRNPVKDSVAMRVDGNLDWSIFVLFDAPQDVFQTGSEELSVLDSRATNQHKML